MMGKFENAYFHSREASAAAGCSEAAGAGSGATLQDARIALDALERVRVKLVAPWFSETYQTLSLAIETLSSFLSRVAPSAGDQPADPRAAHSEADDWQREPLNESGLWWWWNEDEDSLPIVVEIAFSGTDGSYFAMLGQHGWNRYQTTAEMGGWWKRCIEPACPADRQPPPNGKLTGGTPSAPDLAATASVPSRAASGSANVSGAPQQSGTGGEREEETTL